MNNEDLLPKLYRVIGANGGYGFRAREQRRAFIVIRRKPSEMPFWLDMEMLKLAGMGQTDGPNRMMAWEFPLPEKLPDAMDLLHSMGWNRVSLKDDGIGGFRVSVGYPNTVKSKNFDSESEAEAYLDKMMLGEI